MSHFWDFRIKEGQANDYVAFYIKYYQEIDNPFYFGYLLHLIVDQYWKNNVDQRYEKEIDGESYIVDTSGNLIKDENWLSYYEVIKMQQRLAKKYELDSKWEGLSYEKQALMRNRIKRNNTLLFKSTATLNKMVAREADKVFTDFRKRLKEAEYQRLVEEGVIEAE